MINELQKVRDGSSIEYSHYINVTTYQPLIGSSYIELPTELKNPAKGLINIKNKANECFRSCHIRHLNPQKKPQRIKKDDKRFIDGLDYTNIEFPVSQKHYNKIETQNSIRINVFGYGKGQPFPIHISKEGFEDQMNLLLITKDKKRHYVLIKDFSAVLSAMFFIRKNLSEAYQQLFNNQW